MFVKICGLTDAAAIAAAVDAGADAVGFVFAASPRQVTLNRARELAEQVPAEVKRVAVMRHPPQTLVDAVLETLEPDWLQTDAEDLDDLLVPSDCEVLPVYRDGSLPPADPRPPRLLFEGAQSGSGQTADWKQAAKLATGTQLILAGGLRVGNVAAAVAHVRPWGIDVSSGVEQLRGRKDPAKIREFIALVRTLENANE